MEPRTPTIATGQLQTSQQEPRAIDSIPNKRKLWGKFEEKTAALQQENNPRNAALVEVNKYLQEPLLGREENPITWWSDRKLFYPRLHDLAMARLCVMPTSVPSERIFSKAGQILTDRRCRLSGLKVKQTMFLHYNM